MPEGQRPSCMNSSTARHGHVLARGLLFLPALALLGFTLWRRSEAPATPASYGEPTEPMRTGEVGFIDGWDARVIRDGAAPLRLRLEPLHPEAGRQAFDAAALARTLRAGSSPPSMAAVDVDAAAEVWRLTVSVADRPGASVSDSELVVGDVSAIRLGGLEPLVPALVLNASRESDPTAARDPLVSLLSFPAAPLLSGESCDLVFWGPAPEGSVRAMIPGFGDIELMAKTRSADRSSRSIARLDGGPGLTTGTIAAERGR